MKNNTLLPSSLVSVRKRQGIFRFLSFLAGGRSSLADLPFQGRRQGIFRFPVIPRVAYQQRVKGSPTINALCCPLGAKTEGPWTLVAYGFKRGVTFISYLSCLFPVRESPGIFQIKKNVIPRP